MTYLNPTPTIAQLQSQILACACCQVAPFVIGAGNIHYPSCFYADDNPNTTVAPDPLPAILLSEGDGPEWRRYAEGAGGLPQGQFLIAIYADTDVGTLEIFGQALCQQLMLQQTGFVFRSVRPRGMASDPESGQRAASDGDAGGDFTWRSLVLEATYGLNP